MLTGEAIISICSVAISKETMLVTIVSYLLYFCMHKMHVKCAC